MHEHLQVHPGSIDTPFVSGQSSQLVSSDAVRPPCPLGRLGTPMDVAQVRKLFSAMLDHYVVLLIVTRCIHLQVCLFLLSERAAYVTCAHYDVHGGTQMNM